MWIVSYLGKHSSLLSPVLNKRKCFVCAIFFVLAMKPW